MAYQLVIAFVLALLVAFLLAAAEAAIGRVSRIAAADWREEGRRGAQALATVLADSAGYLSVSTFVRVLAESSAAVLATIAVNEMLEGFWPVLLTAIGVMVIASFVIGGVSPRTLGRQHAEPIALYAAGTLVWLRRLLGPLARLLVALANAVTPGKGYRDGPFDSEAELRDLVDLAGANSVIEDVEREMIHSVFELGDTVAREVMVPRTDMVAIDDDKTLRQAMALFLRSGFSRVPVIGEDADDPKGLLYFRDVARRLHDDAGAATVPVTDMLRPVPYIPESKPVDALLREMQRDQTHMAIVVDEYGGTAGLVTIEDLIEEIVGEIADEYDREGPGVEKLGDGSLRVPATMHIDDLGELFDVEFEDEDIDTVGGLLTKAIGRVPILGATGEISGLVLTAERMAGRRHRIASVVVRAASDPARESRDAGGAGRPEGGSAGDQGSAGNRGPAGDPGPATRGQGGATGERPWGAPSDTGDAAGRS